MDYRPAMRRTTGISRYAAGLATALAGNGCDVRLYGCFFRGNRRAVRRAPPGARLVAWPVPSRVMRPLARLGWLPTERVLGGIDLFHYTNYILPEMKPETPQVMTIHDLAFEREARFHEARAVGAFRGIMEQAVARCAAFLVPSEATARDCEQYLGLKRDRLFVTPLGVDPAFFALEPRDARVPGRPYVLAVGTLEPRKNHARLIRAFARAGVDAELWIAGGRGWLCDDVEEEARRHERVRLLDHVPDPDLRRVLAGATAVAYPSLLEGFGLPVLEAMAAGKPVLTSAIEPLQGIAGDAALLVDPEDEDAIADGLARIVNDTDLRADLARRGPERARAFTWEACAAATKRAYEAAMA